jgi:hypothetical protein
MTDIVERLESEGRRDYAFWHRIGRDAKAEIERLRAEVQRLRERLNGAR